MKSVESSVFLNALACQNQGRPPVWLMRQAGRYMPEYRALRARYSFLEMCHTPDLITEVTQLPIKVFGFDAAILFSDILLITEALERGLRFEEGAGPIIDRPVTNAAEVDALPQIDVKEKLGYVAEGIKQLKSVLTVPLIGFCGAPFTVASYLIEGQSSRDLKKTKQWLLKDPVGFHQLLEKITHVTIQYLKMQIAAGVDAIQIFDSWANVLSHDQFQEVSCAYLAQIIKALKGSKKPIILFCRGSSAFFPSLAALQPQAISLDWQADLRHIREKIGSAIALQGNLDPDVLYAPAATVQKETLRLLNRMKNDRGYIFNLGHGIHPDTPVSAVHSLVECIKNF